MHQSRTHHGNKNSIIFSIRTFSFYLQSLVPSGWHCCNIQKVKNFITNKIKHLRLIQVKLFSDGVHSFNCGGVVINQNYIVTGSFEIEKIYLDLNE